MAITERLAMLVTLDANGAIKGFNDLGKAADRNLSKTDDRLDRLGSKFQKAGAGMLAGAGLAAAGLYKAGQRAADLEQAIGGTEAVFGEASDAIDEFAKKAAQSAGLSESAFRTATTSIGGQLKGLGFTVDQAATKAVELTQVAADLSATYGGTTAEAVAALGAAFRGEADPAERFNLFLNQNRVNAKAVALGLAETTSNVDAHAKAQATLALITEQSADAQGQFAREADTAAGAQARMRAEVENALAAFGTGVAPIIGDLASGVGGLAEKFNALPAPIQGTISKAATYGTIATAAVGATSLLAGKVLESRDRFRQLSTELPRTSRALQGVGTAAATLGALAALDSLNPLGFLNDAPADINELENALTRLAQGTAADSLGVDFDKLGAALERVTDPSVVTQISHIARAGATLGGLADFGKKGDLEKARDEIEALDSALGQLAARDPAAATAAFNQVARELGFTTADLLPLLDGYESTLAGVDTEQRVAADSLGGIERKARAASNEIGTLYGKFEELTDSLRSSIDADFAYEDALDGTSDALRRLAEANGLVIDADTTRAEKAEAISDATRDARDALLEQADAAAEAAAQAFEFAGKTLTAAEKQQVFRDELVKLTEGLSPRSELRKQIEETIARLDALAADRTATMEIAFKEARVRIAEGKLLGPDGGRRAIGGPVTAGMGYSTNEYLGAGKGFEWFAPANGTVMPAGSNPYGGSFEQTVIINNPLPEEPSKSARHLRRVQLESAGF